MELEKKLSDFIKVLHGIEELMKYYPRDHTLPEIRDLVDEAIRTIEGDLHELDIFPKQESSGV